jgi:CDP-6-deoxy-D-xylo-4-hexulose-3-dehydrase
MTNLENIKSEIDDLIKKYVEIRHPQEIPFISGISSVPVSGKVFDYEEVTNLISAGLDFWLTDGDYSDMFSEKMTEFLGVKNCRLVNSGSSANLVALSALTNKKLKNAIAPGDKVITAAVGFPTTVNPIFQNFLIPIFIDSELGTYNPTFESIENAYYNNENVKAVMLAHTLGNPLEIQKIQEFCKDKNLWLIEDNCDSLGSKHNGKLTGTFGDFSTLSFYPAHHITMGEGGAIITNSTKLKLSADSFRDWGRDCWCKSGVDNTCNKRYDWKLGELPHGYDHKYIYSNIGYNLKLTDLQASIGLSQMDKLPNFILKRKENWQKISDFLIKYKKFFIPHLPTEDSDPSWFGYAITVKENNKFTRDELVRFLDSKNIKTRFLFGGNLVKQPAYKDREFIVSEPLVNADIVVNSTFWIGVYPGINDEMLNYVFDSFDEFIKNLS